MSSLEERVIDQIHKTMRSLYQPGAIEWIEEQYLDERKQLSDTLDEAIGQWRLKQISEQELRQVASEYLKKHMKWLLEFRQSQKRLAS